MAWNAKKFTVAFVVASSACNVAVLYKGDKRSASEIAALSTENAEIEAVDDVMLGNSLFAKYEVLPGVHRVAVRLSATEQHASTTTHLFSFASIPLCFDAGAGRRYVVRSRRISNQTWAPEILDKETEAPVFTWPPADDGTCLGASNSDEPRSGRDNGVRNHR